MSQQLIVWGLSGLLSCVSIGLAADATDTPPAISVLAEYIPVDARLFLEVHDTKELSDLPAGAALENVLAWLIAQVSSSGEGPPPGELDWRKLFAGTVGLSDEQTTDLLLSGRLAIAADGWSELATAVLVARPQNPAALESQLGPRLIPGPSKQRVRRYRLGQDYELGCDGRIVIVGRKDQDTDSLYTRTLRLSQSDHGVSLADLAAFRERMAEVPAGSQVVIYIGTNRRRSAGPLRSSGWQHVTGPPLQTAAIGVLLSDEGVAVETTGRLAAPPQTYTAHDPPIDALLFLPPSTVAAWTYPIDYAAEFKRLKAVYPQGIVRFFIELLQTGMRAGALEHDLLEHLVGDSVLIVGQVPVRPKPLDPEHESLQVPSLALIVETDDPDLVEATLQQMAINLLRLVNLQYAPEDYVRIEQEPIDEKSDGTIRSITLERMFAGGTARELLGSFEISWTVVDRWLILATHGQTIRQIVLARRGEVPLMSADAVKQAMRRVRHPRRLPDMVLVAQPGVAGGMIDSWLRYITRYHPEMLKRQWWQRLRRQYLASQVQLGILPASVAANGAVQVAQTLPNWPAHGRLQAGDRIIAVDSKPLDPNRTLLSLRNRLAMRDHDDRVLLKVVRDGEERDIEIPMPDVYSPAYYVQPFDLLKHISKLSHRFAFASYATWQPSRDLVQTRLELRLATVTAPPPSVLANPASQ